jgi:hypothetical protein
MTKKNALTQKTKTKKPLLKAVKSTETLVEYGQKVNVVGRYRGTIMGWAYSDDTYYYFNGTVGSCIVAQEGMEIDMNVNGFAYVCSLKKLGNTINGYSGIYNCGEEEGSIRGRILKDFDGWLFIGEITTDMKYKVYIELWK